MNLNQIKHAGTILRQGLKVCDELGATLHGTRMAYMMAVCRVLGCGGGRIKGEEAPEADAENADDTMWTMAEIEELQVIWDSRGCVVVVLHRKPNVAIGPLHLWKTCLRACRFLQC